MPQTEGLLLLQSGAFVQEREQGAHGFLLLSVLVGSRAHLSFGLRSSSALPDSRGHPGPRSTGQRRVKPSHLNVECWQPCSCELREKPFRSGQDHMRATIRQKLSDLILLNRIELSPRRFPAALLNIWAWLNVPSSRIHEISQRTAGKSRIFRTYYRLWNTVRKS
jgi:hypothetical protein